MRSRYPRAGMKPIDPLEQPRTRDVESPLDWGNARAEAVPLGGSAGALIGVILGWFVGRVFLGHGVIEPGTSSGMAPAVVGAVGGGIGWLVGALSRMIVHREDRPVTPREARALFLASFGVLSAGLLLAYLMPMFEDAYKDPRMFRLQQLIMLDAVFAAATCLIVAQRRLTPRRTLALLTVTGLVFLAVAASQFLPFLAECAP
ncbi:MAG: hypothetical protein H0X05_06710, partial [Actinobacteria bacterium]|nr:hypothetical protein [Actinomycetota bacterium]